MTAEKPKGTQLNQCLSLLVRTMYILVYIVLCIRLSPESYLSPRTVRHYIREVECDFWIFLVDKLNSQSDGGRVFFLCSIEIATVNQYQLRHSYFVLFNQKLSQISDKRIYLTKREHGEPKPGRYKEYRAVFTWAQLI